MNTIQRFSEICSEELIKYLHVLHKKGLLRGDMDDVIRCCNDNNNNIEKKPSIVLPYCGVVNNNKCYAMRKNHGLFTQCRNKLFDENYCSVCKEAAKNSPTNKPPHGDIRNREQMEETGMLNGLLPYANIMIKLNISKKRAIEEALKFGLTIPDDQFIEKKIRRGRPKKQKIMSSVVSDTDSDGEIVKKKRGRPKKEQETEPTQDDMIAALAAMC